MSDAEMEPKDLSDWVRRMLETALDKQRMRSVLLHRGSLAWPLLIDAAMVTSFLPRDLAPNAVKDEERAEVEQIVLGFAETTQTVDGVRWSLTQSVRAEVLEAALGTEDLKKAIERTAGRFSDPINQALRKCLTGEITSASQLDLASPEALRIAVSLLAEVSGLGLPNLNDLDREIEFRRLLKPFERMIGRGRNEKGLQRTDRFFGREQEMEWLREYVGVIPADSLVGRTRRAVNWVSRAIRGRAPLMVWGVGGVGKTTLISKFMLEHAEAAVSRYPFAYLDFDRASLSARRRLGLLAEMCLQTGSQFEELFQPMADLRASVRQSAVELEGSGENETRSLTRHSRQFRRLLDERLDALEKAFEWKRPFLLVFDTFEVVQYSRDGIAALEEFVRGFSLPRERDKVWPRLRLIISGRKKLETFLGPVEDLLVGALNAEGSAEMLVALALDAGKPIKVTDAKRLVTAVAKATGERGGGEQPLRLRLIGEAFRNTAEDGPTIVTSLLRELKEPLKSGGLAAQVLIDGVLIRRVLEHVADERVKALADPGLVVRRITPDIIKEVMTRGTSKPSAREAENLDDDPAEPWIIDDSEAQHIYDAFSSEVSLVESDGEALRHRADVRSQMLPLIRARRPNRFTTLNRLAFDYYSGRAERDESDYSSAAEAVYHGLWLNEPLSNLNRLWPNSPSFDPRIEPEEYDEGSLASVFLRAKARGELAPNEVSRLPRDLALEWLDAQSTDLLKDLRIEDSIDAIRIAAGNSYEALDEHIGIAAVLARLLYRAGIWEEALELSLRHLNRARDYEFATRDRKKRKGRKAIDLRQEALLSLVRTCATIVGKSGGPVHTLEPLSKIASSVDDPATRVEIAAYTSAAWARLGDEWRKECQELRSVVSDSALTIDPDRWREKENQRVLRLAILTGEGEMSKLLEVWVESRMQLPRDVDVSVISDLFLEVFRDPQRELKRKA